MDPPMPPGLQPSQPSNLWAHAAKPSPCRAGGTISSPRSTSLATWAEPHGMAGRCTARPRGPGPPPSMCPDHWQRDTVHQLIQLGGPTPVGPTLLAPSPVLALRNVTAVLPTTTWPCSPWPSPGADQLATVGAIPVGWFDRGWPSSTRLPWPLRPRHWWPATSKTRRLLLGDRSPTASRRRRPVAAVAHRHHRHHRRVPSHREPRKDLLGHVAERPQHCRRLAIAAQIPRFAGLGRPQWGGGNNGRPVIPSLQKSHLVHKSELLPAVSTHTGVDASPLPRC